MKDTLAEEVILLSCNDVGCSCITMCFHIITIVCRGVTVSLHEAIENNMLYLTVKKQCSFRC